MSVHPTWCALFGCLAFVLAGVVQTWWLNSHLSRRFAIPIDGGRTFRGKRVLGDNKTLRGFLVMVPACALSFVLAREIVESLSSGELWSLSVMQYACLGAWCGLGYMAAELPSSFVKRQLGVAPGHTEPHSWQGRVFFVVDQMDSVLGGLVALCCFVPVPLMSWIYILFAGGLIHWGFNGVLCLIGMKKKVA